MSIPAVAIDTLHFEISSVAGPSWQAEGVTLNLTWKSPKRAEITLSAARVRLPEPFNNVRGLTLECSNAMIEADVTRCSSGVLRLDSPLLERPQVGLDFTYHQSSGELILTLKDVKLAGGSMLITGNLTDTGWRLNLQAQDLNVEKLPTTLQPFIKWPGGYKNTGQLSLAAQLSGSGNELAKVSLTGSVSSLNFSDPEGHRAGEDLAADFQLNAEVVRDSWQFETQISANQGQLYLEPLFIEFSREAVKLGASGAWYIKQDEIAITQLTVDHPQIGQAQSTITLRLNPGHIENATLKVVHAALAPLYKVYLQPMLIGTAFDRLEGGGYIGVELDYRRRALLSLQVNMDDVAVEDQGGRYGLNGMSGNLAWTRGANPIRSALNWQAGHVYKLPLGAGSVQMQSSQSNVSLVEGVALPILDGTLQIDSFSMEQIGKPALQVHLTGALTPVSMEAVSEALGWPAMTGKLSGIIPSLVYNGGKVEVGGALLVKAFDGNIVMRNVQMERLFGVSPTLSADIDIDNLDLDTLTRTFSFGNIQGRLSGTVDDLRMGDWRPLSFNARFATPADDASRHRISQKAVDSLSSLGGVEGALSRSFLRFFEEFSYARLGLTCRLQNGICEMDGVEPAEKGYYIVKGGGIPRIDVIGYSRKVDWNVLVERLKRITGDEGPIIQ